MTPYRTPKAESRTCILCQSRCDGPLADHIRGVHGEDALKRVLLEEKRRGVPDAQIGAKYGVSFRYLERVITEATGANVSDLSRKRRVTHWAPQNFRPETTTVWSFKQRGRWATHDGRYRGNWSPYIPRNLILRYSRPGEVVLDPFVGGGTTAVEAKLLGRRCVALDVNPEAVRMTLENLDFVPAAPLLPAWDGPAYEPEVRVGDARDLADVPDASVDLICTHPPYAGIVDYSTAVAGDLSRLPHAAYLEAMRAVAAECFRVLKPGRHCAVLIGDARQKKRVVPIGFQVIRLFLDAGFRLRELIIKRQHNCKTTGFWYEQSLRRNFLLLAHEYLPVFEKPAIGSPASRVPGPGPTDEVSAAFYRFTVCPEADESFGRSLKAGTRHRAPGTHPFETTTVWVLPPERMDAEIRRNLRRRYAADGAPMVEVRIRWTDPRVASSGRRTGEVGPIPNTPGEGALGPDSSLSGAGDLGSLVRASPGAVVFVRYPPELRAGAETAVRAYVRAVRRMAADVGAAGRAVLVVETRDVRVGGYVEPFALWIYESLQADGAWGLRDVVIVVPAEPSAPPTPGPELEIIHKYLLVFSGG